MSLYRVPLWKIKSRQFVHPLAPRLGRAHWSPLMAKVSIPFTVPTKRADEKDLPLDQIALIGFALSSDNGQTYTDVGHAAANASVFEVEGLSPGNYMVRATATDTQATPLTSAFSNIVGFQIAAPPLAAPNAPVLGTPVVS